jgi:1,4-dihydroxy-2-naphthoyl-CoA hydrolase
MRHSESPPAHGWISVKLGHVSAEESIQDLMPFANTFGIEFVKTEPAEIRARLAYRPELSTTGSALHGGVLMALADSAGGICAFLNLPEGSTGTSTIESKTNFLGPVRAGHVEAISRPLHRGRTVIVVDTELRDDSGMLVARVTQSQVVLSH